MNIKLLQYSIAENINNLTTMNFLKLVKNRECQLKIKSIIYKNSVNVIEWKWFFFIEERIIIMTEKIFYSDPHITQFNAKVLTCEPQKDQIFRITLDKTAFFPEAGGQNADLGTINNLPVIDVQIENDIIYHFIKSPLLVGSTVTGQVNWEQRFDYMQQHSGEHLMSGLILHHYGFNNVGFHLSDEEVTLDVDGILTLKELRDIELEANEAIYKNLPIKISFPSPNALKQIDYRSKIAIEGSVRIVEIPEYDICACCAPHVDTTGQIGLIKVTNIMKHRGGTRINILCGKRALHDYSSKQDSVSSVSIMLSSKPQSISNAVERLKEENAKQKNRIIFLQQQLLDVQIKQIPSEVDNVSLFFEVLDSIAMRNAVNALCEMHRGYCSIFTGNDMNGYHFIIGSLNKDCKFLSNLLAEHLNTKSGGSLQMIQGHCSATKERIENFFESL